MKKQKKWWTVDCETDPFGYALKIEPFIWAAHDGNETLLFTNSEFVAWAKKQKNTILYGHNAGKFDWLMSNVIDNIEGGTIMLINNRIARARLGHAELRDSWLCLPAALKKFEKQRFDYSKLLRINREKYMHEIEQYIISDVVILYKAMKKFIDAHGTVLTQATAALKSWENMGGVKRRYSNAHDEKFREKWYKGGICKVFKYCRGDTGPFYLYDINSSYPYSMTFRHPLGTSYYRSYNRNDIVGPSFWEIIKSGESTFLTGWELIELSERNAMPSGEYRGWIPAETESLLPYVEKYMADKESAEQKGDVFGRQIAKIFLNSLYGCYGLNPRNHVHSKLVEMGDYDDGLAGYSYYCDVGTDTREIWNKRKTAMTFRDVALAASITGHARATLNRAIFQSAIDVVYCDTDSIVCRAPGPNMKIGNKLGEWKLEAVIEKLWIAGKKLYCMELATGKTKKASKGVKASVSQIKRAAAGEIVKVLAHAPTLKLDGSQTYVDRKIKIV